MSGGSAKRARRVQFSLAAMFLLTAAIAVSIALAMADWQFVLIWITYAVAPFVVGFGVGKFSSSRAQLLTAPPVAAAITPLPWALIVAAIGPTTFGNPVLDFLGWWVMFFPIVLFLGAIPALGGAALAYSLKRRNLAQRKQIAAF